MESGNELGTGSSGFVLDGTDNKVTTSFTVTLSGEYKIVFQVSNNISQIQETTDQTVMVAGMKNVHEGKVCNAIFIHYFRLQSV